MKKRSIVKIGLAITLLSTIFILGEITFTLITGSVIVNSLLHNPFSLLTIFIFILGLLITSSGDQVQNWLENKEKEQESPSLKNKKQTLREKLHFLKRNILGKLLIKRKELSEREKEENERKKEYEDSKTYKTGSQKSLYPHQLTSEQELKTIHWEYEKKQRDEEKKKAGEKVRDTRIGNSHSLLTEIKRISRGIEDESWAPDRETGIGKVLDNLDKLYSSIGMKFAREPYEKILKEKGIKAAEVVLKRLEEYVLSNEHPVTHEEIYGQIKKASGWLRLGNQSFTNEGREKISHQMAKKYAEETKTVSVSEASEQYDVKIVHGIPYYKDGWGNYPQFYNNEYWKSKNNPIKGQSQMTLEDFVDNILSKKPDLSASAIRKDSSTGEFYSPYGVIIKEGKIYDAAAHDIASQGASEKERVKMRLSGGSGSIHERVRNASRERPESYNEFVVGDNHTIGGLYFVEGHQGWSVLSGKGQSQTEIVQRLAKEAIKYHVPLYKFKEEQGFIEVNPNDYLDKRKILDESKPKNSRKTIKT